MLLFANLVCHCILVFHCDFSCFLNVLYIFKFLYSHSDCSLFSCPWDVNPLFLFSRWLSQGVPGSLSYVHFPTEWFYIGFCQLLQEFHQSWTSYMLIYQLYIPKLWGDIISDFRIAYAIYSVFQLLWSFILLFIVLCKSKNFNSLKFL